MPSCRNNVLVFAFIFPSMRLSWLLFLPLLALASGVFAQSGDKPGESQAAPPQHWVIPPAPALEIDQALKTFTLAPGFRIEAVASEPMVHDPIVLQIDEAGRYWVVEMRGFMPNVDGIGEGAPVGSIAVLEDTDGDGRLDRRTEFATGLVMPRALLRVGDGVLVGEPPHLWFMRDTDGDGRADQKIEVAADYGDTANPEHTANSLFWGMDNWIYSANFTARFRYNPDGSWTREPTRFRGQWGLTHDDEGRLYFNNNSVPLQADAFPSEYLDRNPAQPFSLGLNRRLADPKALTLFPGRITPGINRGYRTLGDDGILRSVTAACAPWIYRETLFPGEFAGNAFICEPAANLVKRILISDTERVLAAVNAYPESEFLTSTDERFRPVNLTSGPDGALYIVDMYRGILQHRIYITSYLRKQIEDRALASPIGLGRLYRVLPTDASQSPVRRLPAQMDTAERVAALDHRDGWWRDTAQRLLVQSPDAKAVPLLNTLARSTSASALGRMHALWTLQGMNALDRETVVAALGDNDPRVARTAMRLAERWLQGGDAALVTAVAALTSRSDPGVRLQAAFSLGEAKTPQAHAALLKLARLHPAQPYLNEALVSSLAGQEFDLIEAVATGRAARKRAGNLPVVVTATAAVLSRPDAATQARLFALLTPESSVSSDVRLAVLEGIELAQQKASGSKAAPLSVAIPPEGLSAWAAHSATPPALAARARKAIDLLRWPGRAAPAEAKPVAVELTAAEKLVFEKGRELYAVCAGCHQPDGRGLAGLAPALLNSRWVTGPPDILARIVLQGKEGTPLVMPPLGALDDATLASILTYVRHAWGHAASAVTPQAVAAVRAATLGRDEPWKQEELEALVR